MSVSSERVDVAVIGGGYYGYTVANEIKAARPELDVLVLEQEAQPFTQAASTNQRQLHAGYMYSKFPDVARECVAGEAQFRALFGEAVRNEVTTYYGVHHDSEISEADYEAFCAEVGLRLTPAVDPPPALFGESVGTVFETAEKTFSNAKLQTIIAQQLAVCGARLATSFQVETVRPHQDGLTLQSADGREVSAGSVFNATFAGSNAIHKRSDIPELPLDHAVFLHFGIRLPEQYRDVGLLVVRGQYAALTPTDPAQAATHTLASGKFRVVRTSTVDAPDASVSAAEVASRYEQAIAEARTYMPLLARAEYVDHTIGTRTNYIDPETGVAASRAKVLREYGGIPNYHVVFGGKVSCLTEIIAPIREITADITR